MDFVSQWHGLLEYSQALQLQNESLEKVKQGEGPILLGMEHPLVLTLGLRSHQDPHIDLYKSLFPNLYKIRRGGHLVVHNPGQLVIYPICNLRSLGIGIRDYVCLLIKTTKKLFKEYEVKSFEKNEPGLYTDTGKIAMYGIGVQNGITQHGLCLNINNDLDIFKHISVCDVSGQRIDSLQSYSAELELAAIFNRWCEIFQKI